MTIRTADLTFIDLSIERYGAFADQENIDSFLQTNVGKAQLTSLTQEMAAQEDAQGNANYIPTTE